MNRLDYFYDYWQPINSLSPGQREHLMDFGMGMPPPKVFTTPEIVLTKLHESIDLGDYCRYVPTEGGPQLLEDIVTLENQYLPDCSPKYSVNNVMLVPGGIQAFSLLVDALLSASEKILIPNPSYFSLGALTEERHPYEIVEGENFNFTAKDYQGRFKTDVGLAWFCQPNNPTGLYIEGNDLSEAST